jgi:hypothetical protein
MWCSLLSAQNTVTWENSNGSNPHFFIHPPLSLPFSRIYFHQSWQPQFVQIRGQKRKQDPNSHLDNHRMDTLLCWQLKWVRLKLKKVFFKPRWLFRFEEAKRCEFRKGNRIIRQNKLACSLRKFISQVARLLDSTIYSKDNLSRSATLNDVQILGQPGKEM